MGTKGQYINNHLGPDARNVMISTTSIELIKMKFRWQKPSLVRTKSGEVEDGNQHR